MRFTSLLALGLGNVALAQNSTTLTWTKTSSLAPTPSSKPNGFPGQRGGYQFYGCVKSSEGSPTFSRTASDKDMSLDLCAASCPSRFFAVSATDCYCGEEIDEANTQRVANSQCNTPCPGNDAQYCGGMAGSLRVRRQSVSLSVLLTLYIRVADAEESGIPKPTDSGAITSTVTSTSTGTITSCPPEVPDCPIGQPTVTTITSTICPAEPTPDHSKVIICYGDYCAWPNPCEDEVCTKHRVVCEGDSCHREECEADDEHWNKLVICEGEECKYPQCKGDECHKKVVCYGDKCAHEKCYGDECQKKLVCHGDECGHETCEGDECYTKVVCEDEECKPEPPCEHPECPVPPPPAPPSPPAHPCEDEECKPEPPCEGPECPVPLPPAPPSPPAPHPCEDEECKPEPPCEGPECPVPPPAPPAPHPTGGIVPPPGPPEPPVAGSSKMLPAFGIGAIAGLAFFL